MLMYLFYALIFKILLPQDYVASGGLAQRETELSSQMIMSGKRADSKILKPKFPPIAILNVDE